MSRSVSLGYLDIEVDSTCFSSEKDFTSIISESTLKLFGNVHKDNKENKSLIVKK